MNIHLNLKEMLPVIREAFDNKSLQMFTLRKSANKGCLYDGPCAIGVCIPKNLRIALDNGVVDNSAVRYFKEGIFKTNSDEEEQDILGLQDSHDYAAIYGDGWGTDGFAEFGEYLSELEKKYFG